VRQEAKLSVETMDSASAFEDLFMKPVSFFHKYDQTFQSVDLVSIVRSN